MSNTAPTTDPWADNYQAVPYEDYEELPEPDDNWGGPCGSCHDYTCPSITRGGLCPETY